MNISKLPILLITNDYRLYVKSGDRVFEVVDNFLLKSSSFYSAEFSKILDLERMLNKKDILDFIINEKIYDGIVENPEMVFNRLYDYMNVFIRDNELSEKGLDFKEFYDSLDLHNQALLDKQIKSFNGNLTKLFLEIDLKSDKVNQFFRLFENSCLECQRPIRHANSKCFICQRF